MPYHTIEDLPERVRHVLPLHAQKIYLSSFNSAHEEYQDKDKKRDPNEDLEVLCHKVAWSAVKNKYQRDSSGQWVEIDHKH